LSFPYVCPEPVLAKCSFLYINGSKMPFSAGLAPNPFIATAVYGFLDATTGTYCTIYYLLALHCTALHCTALHCTALLYRTMHRPTYQPTALCMHLTRNDKLLLCMRACCYNTLCLLIVSSLHTALRVCLSVCLSVCVCDSCRAAWLRGLGELHGGRRRGHRDAQRHMEHNRL
jgi:hypothetical protein